MGLCKVCFEDAISIHPVVDPSFATSRTAVKPHCEICNAD